MRLRAEALTKTFGPFTALEKVAVDFPSEQIHAVLGENGAGKSTLMKVLFGLLQAEQGKIFIDEKEVVWDSPHDAIAAGLGMVQQHFTLVETLSALDNILVGAEICAGPFAQLERKAAQARLEAILSSRALSVPWELPLSKLSVGQKQKVEILKLLFRNARILFLDEPTAVLAPEECKEFFAILKKLKAEGRTIVLITHRLSEVMEVCDTFTVLRQGRVTARGEVSGASQASLVEAMIGRSLEEWPKERPPARAEDICRFRNVNANGLSEISLNIRAGEIVGIAGVEGSGQAELVQALLTLRPIASGHAELLNEDLATLEPSEVRELGVGLIPEDRLREGLWLEESAYDNLSVGLEKRFSKFGWLSRTKLRSTVADWAKAFDVRASSLDAPVKSLSGGNQQKLVYAREVEGRKPKFLIAHQPSRGVDLGAMDLIHRKLLQPACQRNGNFGVEQRSRRAL